MCKPERIHRPQTHAGSMVATSPPPNRWNSCAPNASHATLYCNTMLLVLRVFKISQLALWQLRRCKKSLLLPCVALHVFTVHCKTQLRIKLLVRTLEKVITASKEFTSGFVFFWCVWCLAIFYSQPQLRIGFLKCSNLKRWHCAKPTPEQHFFFDFWILGAPKVSFPNRRCSKNQNLHSRARRR